MQSPSEPTKLALSLVNAVSIGEARTQTREHPRLGAFRSLEFAVRTRMLAGRGLSEVEEQLIDPAPLSAEKKAVLWLLAWSLLPPSYQLAEVESHIRLLSRSTESVD